MLCHNTRNDNEARINKQTIYVVYLCSKSGDARNKIVPKRLD